MLTEGENTFDSEDFKKALTDPIFRNYQTPLMIAIENGDSNMVNILFKAGDRVGLELTDMAASRCGSSTDFVKFAKEQLVRAEYDQNSLECLQRLKLAGGFYEEAITSAVAQLADKLLYVGQMQEVIADCKQLKVKHEDGGLLGFFIENKFEASYVKDKKLPILVAYLSIVAKDSGYIIESGDSEIFSLFVEKNV